MNEPAEPSRPLALEANDFGRESGTLAEFWGTALDEPERKSVERAVSRLAPRLSSSGLADGPGDGLPFMAALRRLADG